MAMNSIAQWLVSCAMGALTVTNVVRHVNVANDKETAPRTVSIKNTSAIDSSPMSSEEFAAMDHSDLTEPPDLGSETVNAALQRLFSSEENRSVDRSSVYIDAMHNDANKQEYTLGSEALNRILEGLQTPSGGVPSKRVSFEPPANV
ncbi:uncharacterized protein LOC108161595 [Drosophila miranda]|uniref:GA14595 n=1 Tax=Drosophila miranda TaxID=7229 RepID=D0QWI3_DROMI|nr:uncharacterized protein LOC108161595 [Drosophila miranda]ACN94682.1 GA14595 [Drosophila miranda]